MVAPIIAVAARAAVTGIAKVGSKKAASSGFASFLNKGAHSVFSSKSIKSAGSSLLRSKNPNVRSVGGSMMNKGKIPDRVFKKLAVESNNVTRGLLKETRHIAKKLDSFSPFLKQQFTILKKGIGLTFRPLGDLLARWIAPIGRGVLNAAIFLNKLTGGLGSKGRLTKTGYADRVANLEDQKAVAEQNQDSMAVNRINTELDYLKIKLEKQDKYSLEDDIKLTTGFVLAERSSEEKESQERLTQKLDELGIDVNDLSSKFPLTVPFGIEQPENLPNNLPNNLIKSSNISQLEEMQSYANGPLGNTLSLGVKTLMEKLGVSFEDVEESVYSGGDMVEDAFFTGGKQFGFAAIKAGLDIGSSGQQAKEQILAGFETAGSWGDNVWSIIEPAFQNVADSLFPMHVVSSSNGGGSSNSSRSSRSSRNYRDTGGDAATEISNIQNSSAWGNLSPGVQNLIGSMAIGGQIKETGDYRLHAGEKVIASEDNKSNSENLNITNTFYIKPVINSDQDINALSKKLATLSTKEMRRRVSYGRY